MNRKMIIDRDGRFGMDVYKKVDLSKDYEDSEVEDLTPRQVWFIRKHLREGDFAVDEIARDVDCKPETVLLIHYNKIYKHVGHYKSEFLSLS